MLSEALLMMPVTFKSLVVENTTRCNAQCGMCYQSVGPKGSDAWGKASLTKEEVEQVVRDAVHIERLGRRFHLAGGESFLKVDDVIYLLAVAREAGFTNISTTTNAYWGKKPERADNVARRIREAGLTSMEISWDYWHVPYIHPEAINNCVKACARYDIQVNLRLLTTKSHSAAEALSHLDPEAIELAGEISSCPVFPTGRAKHGVPSEDIYSSCDLTGACHHMLNLTVNALGNVAPCCAGADQTEGLSFGNVREKSIVDIVKYMQSSPKLRVLVFHGVSALLPILEDQDISMGKEYSNICHLCFEIFNNPERAAIIHEHFDDQVRQALLRSLSRYSQKMQLDMQPITHP